MSAANYLGMWTPAAATWTEVGIYWRLTRTGSGPTLTTPAGLDYPGPKTFLVRVRARKIAGGAPSDGWVGQLTFANGVHSFSASFRKDIPAPSVEADVWTILEWDLSTLTVGGTDWVDNGADQVRIAFDDDPSSVWEIDYIVFGGRGYGRNIGDVGKNDRVVGSLAKTAAVGNRVLDDLIQDTAYWALDTGWAIDTTSTDVTGTGANQLALPAAFKSPTGDGTKTQATTAARVTLGRDTLADVVEGEAIVLGCRVSAEPTFTGRPQVTVLFYEADGLTLLNGTGEGWLVFENDYRNGAPGGGSNTIFDIARVVRVPVGARYARLATAVDWPDVANSQNAASFCFMAKPFIGSGLTLAALGVDTDNSTQVATNTVGVWTTVGNTVLQTTSKLLSLDGTLYVRSSTAQAKGFKWRWRVVDATGSSITLFESGTFTTPAVGGTVIIPGDLEYEYIAPAQGVMQVFLEVSPTETTNGNLEVIKMVLKAADDRTEL